MAFVWIYWIALISTCAPDACEGRELSDGISRFIFGDIWKFSQFCGRNLSGTEKASNDFEYQGYLNGSTLQSIAHLEDAQYIQKSLNKLIHTGLKARSSISTICSISSWGYADEKTSEQSNSIETNLIRCQNSLDRMLASLKIISNQRENTFDECNLLGQTQIEWCRSAQNQKFSTNLNDWLMHNTFGRINQGYPFDSHIWLGDYNACNRLPCTRYCFGALRSENWPRLKRQEGDDFIRIGMCLPKVCNSRILSSGHSLQTLDHILSELTQRANDSYLLTDVYCTPEDDSPVRNIFNDPTRVLLLVVSAAWLAVATFATLFRHSEGRLFEETQLPGQYILSDFDVRNNLARFFQTKPDRDGMIGLDFIKVIGMLWLVCSHNFHLIIPYLRNAQDLRHSCNSSPLAMILLQAQHGVVAFFIISGFLVGYKHLKGNRDIDFKTMVVTRYARLAPLYLLAYTFVKKFAHLMSSGPLWDYGVSPQSEMRQCINESWLVPILMLADFIPPFSHCILTGWHIANDFHIFLLVPILLKLYRRSRFAGRLVSFASFAASHLFHFINFHQADNFNFETISQEPITIGTGALMGRLANDYVNPFGRFGTYFLGIFLADVILEERSSGGMIKPPQLTIIRRNATDHDMKVHKQDVCDLTKDSSSSRDEYGLIMALLSLIGCLITPAMPFKIKNLFNPYSKSLAYPLVRLINELCWLYILFYILKKQKPAQRTIATIMKHDIATDRLSENFTGSSNFFDYMRCSFWNICAKLNYTVVIIHFTISRYLIQSQTHLIEFGWLNLLGTIGFNAFTTYLAAFVVHIIVEVPLMSIVGKIERAWQNRNKICPLAERSSSIKK